ncbi:MAG TPA: FAD-dependent oxidoreductase [Chloroflexota bacterium]|nr:FAD-dependent oxidoreductase [Chloroflexota bacterium]
MKIAIVGSGIAGLGAAYLLNRQHHVELFEADARLGGHAHTHTVETEDGRWEVDSAFLVFNRKTYPTFVRLLDQLGVASQETDMSHSVRCARCGVEWSNQGLGGLFAQARRAADGEHLRMVADLPRFSAHAFRHLARPASEDLTLDAFIAEGRYSAGFVRHCLLPFGGAVWSAPQQDVRRFSARAFLGFLRNHGMLTLHDAPRWRTIVGGSRRYVDAIARTLDGPVHLSTPVRRVTRDKEGVALELQGGTRRHFDKVVLATHADQTLRLLGDDATPAEHAALGAFRYSSNRTVLHVDAPAGSADSVLPRVRGARASWNSFTADCRDERPLVRVSYDLNRLQRLKGAPPLCVTLNHEGPLPGRTIAEMTYTHPVMDSGAYAAQRAVQALNAQGSTRHTYFAGAHLGHGFHEDGLVSATRVAAQFGITL